MIQYKDVILPSHLGNPIVEIRRPSYPHNEIICSGKMASLYWIGARCSSRHQNTLRIISLHWRHDGWDSVSNHQCLECLFNRLFRRRSKKTSNLRVTGLCEGNSPVTDKFPSQRASNAKNVSIWWRHHGTWLLLCWVLMQSCAIRFTHIFRDYFTGNVAIIQLPYCSSPEKYGQIYHISQSKIDDTSTGEKAH